MDIDFSVHPQPEVAGMKLFFRIFKDLESALASFQSFQKRFHVSSKQGTPYLPPTPQ
jgi:hypothetical protein